MMTNVVTERKTALHLAMGLVLGLASGIAAANPTGQQVLRGEVAFASEGNQLTVTNSPNAIIQWSQFNIAENEITRFQQQSAESAVLNRVMDMNPSEILGQLTSNGRVFLINPNGVVFGENAVVDVAALVASSLGLSDQDFLNGNFNFTGSSGAGSVNNTGTLRAGANGNVILIAPNVSNGGTIEVGQGGDIVLAAGQQLTLTDWNNPSVQFQLQAPADRVVNLGQLNADGGAARLFAGAIEHSGGIQADRVSVDPGGVVELLAASDITVGDSATIHARGAVGNGDAPGGSIRLESESGATRVAGQIRAVGGTSNQGGSIKVLGDTVSVAATAELNADGGAGGGEILVGGSFQGTGPERQARTTTMASGAVVTANAVSAGDGGRVVFRSNDNTSVQGRIDAQGGVFSGNGGQVEVAGAMLTFAAAVNASASLVGGTIGTTTLNSAEQCISESATCSANEWIESPVVTSVFQPSQLSANTTGYTLISGADIDIQSPLTLATAGAGLALQAAGSIRVNADVATAGGSVVLSSNSSAAGRALNGGVMVAGAVSTGNADITITNNQAPAGAGDIAVNNTVSAGAGNLVIEANTAGLTINSALQDAATITIVADDPAIGALLAPTQSIRFENVTAGAAFDLGHAVEAANAQGLSVNELDFIAPSILLFDVASMGDLRQGEPIVDGSFSASGLPARINLSAGLGGAGDLLVDGIDFGQSATGGTLVLRATNGSVSDSGAQAALNVRNLSVQSATGITLNTQFHDVDNFAASNATSGDIVLHDKDGLTVGLTLDQALQGIANANGKVTLVVGDGVGTGAAIEQDQNAGARISAAALDVSTFAGNAAGAITLSNPANAVTTVTLKAKNLDGTQNNAADIAFQNTGSVVIDTVATAGRLSLAVAGAVTQSSAADRFITADELSIVTLDDAGQSIVLNNVNNAVNKVNLATANASVTGIVGADITFANGRSLQIGPCTQPVCNGIGGIGSAGAVTLSVAGDITQDAAVSVDAARLTLNVASNANVNLTGANNQITVLDATVTNGAGATGSFAVSSSTSLIVDNLTSTGADSGVRHRLVSTGGDVAFNSDNDGAVNIANGDLVVEASGSILDNDADADANGVNTRLTNIALQNGSLSLQAGGSIGQSPSAAQGNGGLDTRISRLKKAQAGLTGEVDVNLRIRNIGPITLQADNAGDIASQGGITVISTGGGNTTSRITVDSPITGNLSRIKLKANEIAVNAAVTSGNGIVVLLPFTNTLGMKLGGNATESGFLALSAAELGRLGAQTIILGNNNNSSDTQSPGVVEFVGAVDFGDRNVTVRRDFADNPAGTVIQSGAAVSTTGTFTTQQLTINAGGTLSTDMMATAGTLQNAGTLNLTGQLTAASLTNSGVFNVNTGGSTTPATVQAAFSNTGTMTLAKAVNLQINGNAASHSGTLNIIGGDLVVQGAAGGSFTLQGGTINIAQGRNYIQRDAPFRWDTGTVTGMGRFLTNSNQFVTDQSAQPAVLSNAELLFVNGGARTLGAVTYADTFTLDNGSLTIQGTPSVNEANALVLSGGLLMVNGAATITDQATLIINGGMASFNSGLTNAGTLSAVDGFMLISNTFTQTAGSTAVSGFGLEGVDVAINGGAMTAGGAVSLDGASTFAVNGSTVAFNSGVTNAGTLSVANGGALVVSGQLTNTGTITGEALIINPSSGMIAQAITSGLTVNGGVVQSAGSITVNTVDVNGGNVSIQGGTLTAAGAVDLDATSTLVVGGGTVTLNNDVTNAGTVSVAGGSALTVNGRLTNSGAITGDALVVNPATGLITTALANVLTVNGGFTQTAGSTTVNALNLNDGTLSIQSGTLTAGGAVAIAAGTTLDVGSGTATFNGSVTNAGTVSSANGVVSINNGFTQTAGATTVNALNLNGGNTSIQGGTLTAGGAVTIAQGATLDINGNTATFNGSVTNAGTVSAANGTVLLNGAFTQTAGSTTVNALSVGLNGGNRISIQGGTLTAAGAAMFDATTTFAVSGGAVTFNDAVTNAGTLSVTDGGMLTVNGQLTNSGTLTGDALVVNPATGLTATAAASNLTVNGGFTQTAGSTTVNALNLNDGTLSIQSGTLTAGGAVAIAAGTTLDVGSGTATFNGSVTNAGTVSSANGVVSINNGFTQTAGATTVNALNLNGGNTSIQGGTLTAGGAVTIAQGATLDINGNTATFNGSVTNAGTVSAANGTVLLNGAFTQTAGSTTVNTLSLTGNGVSIQGGTLTAAGLVDLGVGTTFAVIGGAVTLNNGVTNAGTLAVANTGMLTVNGTLTNTGQVISSVDQGGFQVNGAFVQTAGSTCLGACSGLDAITSTPIQQAVITVSTVTDGDVQTFGDMRIDGGRLKGEGRVAANVELGTAQMPSGAPLSIPSTTSVFAALDPGQSPGKLTIGGNYTQGAGGALLVEANGLSAADLDTVTVEGNATVDGVLQVRHPGNVDPGNTAVELLVVNGTADGDFAEALFTSNGNTVTGTAQVISNGVMIQNPVVSPTDVEAATDNVTGDVINNSGSAGSGFPSGGTTDGGAGGASQAPQGGETDAPPPPPQDGSGGDGDGPPPPPQEEPDAQQEEGAAGEDGTAGSTDGDGAGEDGTADPTDGAGEGDGGEAPTDEPAPDDKPGPSKKPGEADDQGEGDRGDLAGDDDTGAVADESEADEPEESAGGSGGDCGPRIVS